MWPLLCQVLNWRLETTGVRSNWHPVPYINTTFDHGHPMSPGQNERTKGNGCHLGHRAGISLVTAQTPFGADNNVLTRDINDIFSLIYAQ
jgi:hypothetical protein